VTEALPFEVAQPNKNRTHNATIDVKNWGGGTSSFIALLTGNDLWATPFFQSEKEGGETTEFQMQ